MENSQIQTQKPQEEYGEAPPSQAPNVLEEQQMGSQGGYQQLTEGPQEQEQQQFGYGGYQQPFGYQQPYSRLAPGDVGPFEMTSMGMKARTAGWLSYLFGWATGLLFLLLERENRFVRFHAMQSLLFFGALSIVGAVLNYIPYFGFVSAGLFLVGFVCWIVLMVAAHRGRYYKLPVIGDYAEKWANAIRM